MQNKLLPISYYQPQEFSARLKGTVIPFISKPGLLHWDQVTPAAHLLADEVNVPSDATALLVGCSHGALGVVLARQLSRGTLWLMDTSAVALAMAAKTIKQNNIANAHTYSALSMLPDFADGIDVIIMELPKGRKAARRWLLEAHAALKLGGRLYVAGANDEGIQSILDDAKAVFGTIAILRYKKGNRVASTIKRSQEVSGVVWAQEPGMRPGSWYEFDVNIDGVRPLHIHSLPGIFSFDRVDDGTKLLVSNLLVPQGATVLDVGCGYGLLGMVASLRGAARVDMVDSDLLAVGATAKNIVHNHILNAQAFTSDALDNISQRSYDLIITNPPFHAGKVVAYDAAYAFIERAHAVLKPGGRLLLVANAFIKYDQLLQKLFTKVERVAQDGRYYVVSARLG